MTILVVTRELVGKVVCFSYVTHQKVSYSWVLTITLAYSPLKLTSSTTAFNRKKGRGTCQFYLRVTQLAAGSSFGCKSSQVGRKSLDGLVCHSAWLLIGRNSDMKFLSHANFCRVRQVTRVVRVQVAGIKVIGVLKRGSWYHEYIWPRFRFMFLIWIVDYEYE